MSCGSEPRLPAASVPEMANAGEHHGHVVRIRGCYGLGILH
jgi:hypothetical protein